MARQQRKAPDRSGKLDELLEERRQLEAWLNKLDRAKDKTGPAADSLHQQRGGDHRQCVTEHHSGDRQGCQRLVLRQGEAAQSAEADERGRASREQRPTGR